MIARSTCQILQTVRKRHAFQILVEILSRSQTVRQGHTFTKSQTDKALWKTKRISCSNGVVKCVTPSKENSASEVSSSIIKKHHAACNWVGTNMIIRSTCQILQTVRKRHAFQIHEEMSRLPNPGRSNFQKSNCQARSHLPNSG